MQQQLRAPDSGDRILIARRLRRTLLGGVVTSSSFPLSLLFFFLFLGYISLTLRERIVGFWHLWSPNRGVVVIYFRASTCLGERPRCRLARYIPAWLSRPFSMRCK
jgi:hypothetical protein